MPGLTHGGVWATAWRLSGILELGLADLEIGSIVQAELMSEYCLSVHGPNVALIHACAAQCDPQLLAKAGALLKDSRQINLMTSP